MPGTRCPMSDVRCPIPMSAVRCASLGASILSVTLTEMGRALLAMAIAGGLLPLAAMRQALSAQPSETSIRATCGGCHAMPPADVLPKAAWPAEVVRMHYIRENRLPPLGRNAPQPQLPPDLQAAAAWYVANAPERLATPDPWPAPTESPLRFDKRAMTMPEISGTPAVSNVKLVDLDGDGKLDVLGTEMRQGVVFSGHPDRAGTLTSIASIPHPSHVAIADVDKDGVPDLLIGDLGTFYPEDHNKGAFIWLRG